MLSWKLLEQHAESGLNLQHASQKINLLEKNPVDFPNDGFWATDTLNL